MGPGLVCSGLAFFVVVLFTPPDCIAWEVSLYTSEYRHEDSFGKSVIILKPFPCVDHEPLK